MDSQLKPKGGCRQGNEESSRNYTKVVWSIMGCHRVVVGIEQQGEYAIE